SSDLAALAAWIAPVGDASILHPDDGDWLAWRRTPDALGYSPLKQIDVSNAGNLAMTWSLSLAPGTNGMVPLVRNGVMFLHASGLVQALDATSGDMLWSYSRPAKSSRTAATQPRGLALYGDTLYVPTIDGHLIALDARTGALRWDHEIVKPKQRLILTATPLAVRGKIIQGVSGCQDATNGGGCFIVALDAATGEEAWRFYSIAEPGQPGGDSWNGAPWSERYGGSVWTTGSYDADLNLVYFGIGQTYVVSTLLKPGSAGERSRDALYTNSTVALDPDSGRLVWHYQHAPGDVWDQDWAFEQTLTTVQTGRGPRKALITSGKEAIIDAVDARTGAYLWSKDLGLQNLIVDINPKTGRKRYDPALTPEQGKFKHVCPSAVGFRNWPATAVDPASGLMFMPITRSCMDIALTDSANPSSWAFGELTIVRRVPPNSDGNYGRLVAVDMNSRQIRWTNDRRAPQSSAVLATGGGLVFEGGRDRYFRALESATGKTVWQVRLDNAPNGFPITYMADGVQYVAIVTGGGTVVDSYFAPYTPEFPPSNGSRSVAVFALPSANRSASR
ncbi:MAG: pyrroloquinoline quinone-dependent dehydrogenase, partial [Sphingomonadaceae bacterium]